MGRHRLAPAAAALALIGAGAAHAEPQVTILPLDFKVTEFRAPSSRVAALVPSTDALRSNRALAERPLVVVWGPGGAAALGLEGAVVKAFPLGRSTGDLATLERGRDAIPDSRVQAFGPFTIALTGANRSPGRVALGSEMHAAEITITERRPVAPGPDPKPVPQVTSHVSAGPGAVFEDRAPRLVDLDGDGTPEIVTIRADAKGAALVVIGRGGEGWGIRAATPTEGEAGTALNPATIADFQGAGHPQITLVRGPERDGVVELWALDGDRLVKRSEKAGYSNHAPGQTAQDLAAAVDLDGDGRPELAVPILDRRAVAILDVKAGFTERTRIALPAPAVTGLAVLGSGAGTHLLVGLEDGRVADIRP